MNLWQRVKHELLTIHFEAWQAPPWAQLLVLLAAFAIALLIWTQGGGVSG